jgi:hypothetical protein
MWEVYERFQLEDLKARNHVEGLGIAGRVILERILGK